MDTYLSPKEFAQVIEASESSIKRWVDKGKIIADYSDGGHRKIPVQEAIRYIRQNQSTVLRADLLGFTDVDSLKHESLSSQIDADRYFQFMIDGDSQKARGYLLKLYLQGHSIPDICDNAVAVSMNKIGTLWQEHEEGICLEHHATDICIQAVNALRMVFRLRDEKPVALGGGPEGDPYFIPSLCISTVLMSEGFRAINLGPNTPADSFIKAIEQYNPSIVWLTLSSSERPRHKVRQIESLAKTVSEMPVQMVIGGRESQNYRYLENQYVFFGANMSEMAAFIRGRSQKSVLPF